MSERSADEWAALGREALNLAMDAIQAGKPGTAEEHRKTAKLAFDMEIRLRTEVINRGPGIQNPDANAN
jgi:hypothetical protein